MPTPQQLLSDPTMGLVTESRPAQLALAMQIEEALRVGAPLLGEAGTGVGKTNAYLVPLCDFLARNPNAPPAVIATPIKSLQMQLLRKDLPRLQEYYPGITFALKVGKQNYLCRRLVERNVPRTKFNHRLHVLYDRFFDTTHHWCLEHKDPALELPVGYAANAVQYCNKERCPHHEECSAHGYLAAKEKESSARILIANHKLAAMDVLLRQRDLAVLPTKMSAIVFDEAHRYPATLCEELACKMNQNFFRDAGRTYDRIFSDVCADAMMFSHLPLADRFPMTLCGLDTLPALYDAMHLEARRSQDDVLGPAATAYAAACKEVVRAMETTFGVSTPDYARWAAGETAHSRGFSGNPIYSFPWGNAGVRLLLENLHNYAKELLRHAAAINIAQRPGESEYVLGVDRDIDRNADPAIQVFPLAFGVRLAHYRAATTAIPIYLSATLAHQDSFGPFRYEMRPDISVEPLRVPTEDELKEKPDLALTAHAARPRVTSNNPVIEFIAGSPFKLREQAMLYTSPRFPDPQDVGERRRYTRAGYIQQLVEEMLPLLHANRGHAFILFTNKSDKDAVAAELRARNLPYPLLVQSDANPEYKTRGRDIFVSTPSAVLLGLKSFYEGIDVPGLHLSLVIIPKLPFEAETTIESAKANRMSHAKIDPFSNLKLPAMLTNLRQMAGRLIRTKDDLGLVAILDPRIHTRTRYSEIVFRALGDYRRTSTRETAVTFLERVSARRDERLAAARGD